ncbi:terminase large subunit [Carboxylicivirga marina]|uniref:Terminase large subunit n=1 Tax=Carboxylicivirga marina TaxID=2800988 RepID=A0ABS1HGE4_9BACT|nr:terminase TerL endonuclease subunit [Carboxylicivirga marina]MBK3516701.1 terminase large subunit [Carboxylicivirga marina]
MYGKYDPSNEKDREAFADEVLRRSAEYQERVLSGEQVAPETIEKAVKRHQAFKEKYEYREDEVRRIAKIFCFMAIPINDRPTQFMPAPWQCFVLEGLFGLWKGDKRVFMFALIHVSRKSGKTMFAAALAIIFFTKLGGMSSEVYGCGTTFDQAKQLLNYCKTIVRNSHKSLKKAIKTFRDSLTYDDGGSSHILKPIANTPELLDGKNPSACVYDESHAFPDDDLKEVIITGMGARANPLFMEISTAGFLTVGYPYFENVALGRKVLDGEVEDDSTLYLIYEMESEEEAASCEVEQLEKANPGLGYSINPERLEEMRKKAKLLPSSWKHFLVKNANIFQTTAEDPFISDEDYLQCADPVLLDELEGARAWIGIDLSQAVDLTAFVVIAEHPETKKLHTIPFHFFPMRFLEKKAVRANGVDLRPWIEEGFIEPHEDRIDEDRIISELYRQINFFKVQLIVYDPHSAHNIVAHLKGDLELIKKFDIVAYAQSWLMMSAPAKYLERLVLGGEINLGQNPVLRYCNSNARVQFSISSNLIRITKDEQLNPIDSMIALVMALGAYMETEYDEINHLLGDKE